MSSSPQRRKRKCRSGIGDLFRASQKEKLSWQSLCSLVVCAEGCRLHLGWHREKKEAKLSLP